MKDGMEIKDRRIRQLESELSAKSQENDLQRSEYDTLYSLNTKTQANLETITIEKERLGTQLGEMQMNDQKLKDEIDKASYAFARNTMLPQEPPGEELCPARQKLFQLFQDVSNARQSQSAHGAPQRVPGLPLNEHPGLRQTIARCVVRLFSHVSQAVKAQRVLTPHDIEQVENEFYEADEKDSLHQKVPEAHVIFLRVYKGYCDVNMQHLAKLHASKILNKEIMPDAPMQLALKSVLNEHSALKRNKSEI
eukprot:1667916-Rhodomonas_salina.1